MIEKFVEFMRVAAVISAIKKFRSYFANKQNLREY